MRKVVATTAAVVLASAAVVAGNAAPALAATKPHSSTTTLTSGVTLTQSWFTMRSHGQSLHQHATVLRVSLSRHVQLDMASPSNVTGATRTTVLSMARQERAVAGINGDTMYFSDPKAVPRGGTSHNGRILKSSLYGKNANLFVTRSGYAKIGNPGWYGSVLTDHPHAHSIRSVNSLENARNGNITMADHNLMSHSVRDCAVVGLVPTTKAGVYRVGGRIAHTNWFSRPAAGNLDLVTCKAPARTWMMDYLVPGHYVKLGAGYRTPGITGLVSGKTVLIHNGKRYNDHTGLLGYGKQRKPQTFACVLPGGRSLLLGTVGGDRKGVAGMTNYELTSYLLGKHCWSAINLDGSGSSTLVAKRPGHALGVANVTTAHGGPRRMVNGVFIVRR